MSEKQYQELCDACDRLLMAPDATIERIAIPWLHVIREHPVFLANYIDLFKSERGVRERWQNLLSIFLAKARWFRQIYRALKSDNILWFGPKELPEGIDVLFVSHLVNSSHAGDKDDFYFGSIPNDLVKHSKSALIALINHSDKPGIYISKKCNDNSTVSRVILSDSLNYRSEIDLRKKLIKESRKLKSLVSSNTPELEKKVIMKASQEALSAGAQGTLRTSHQIKELVGKLKPKVIIIIHEGHAWERVTFAAARIAEPAIECIGYQHAALFRLQHAIQRKLSQEYNPDRIMTAGVVGKILLENTNKLKGIHASVLGSNRRNSIKQKHCDASDKTRKYSKNRTCLVLPEGYISECNLLFEFSLLCAKANRDIQFIWRLHPIISQGKLIKQNPKFKNLPNNVIISNDVISEDLDRCDWALYRGSTAIIPAVLEGLRPIYLELACEMTVDPLYELREWRIIIKEPTDLTVVIKSTPSNPEQRELKVQCAKAREYCSKFYMPLDLSVLLKNINVSM